MALQYQTLPSEFLLVHLMHVLGSFPGSKENLLALRVGPVDKFKTAKTGLANCITLK